MSDTHEMIPYLRRFMSMVDALDGHDDGKVDKAYALSYIRDLMLKTAKAGCDDMHHFLQHLHGAVSVIKEAQFDAAEPRMLVPESLIEAGLHYKLEKSAKGRALLHWNKPLPVCEATAAHMPPVPSVTAQKRER